MKMKTAISRATAHLLKSDKMRTITTRNGGVYILEMEKTPDSRIEISSWGYDRQGFSIPTSRAEVISLKCHAQMGNWDLDKILVRYTLDILRRADS